jgi:hypothetical protein
MKQAMSAYFLTDKLIEILVLEDACLKKGNFFSWTYFVL